jgi:hypothetical protein
MFSLVQFTANFLHSPQLAGGGLVAGKYDFRQLHFHWGANDTRGSEHAIEGRQYPIEVSPQPNKSHVRKNIFLRHFSIHGLQTNPKKSH